jgi:hypothetical protein
MAGEAPYGRADPYGGLFRYRPCWSEDSTKPVMPGQNSATKPAATEIRLRVAGTAPTPMSQEVVA